MIANGNSEESAPKNRKIGFSNSKSPPREAAANKTEPTTAAVKYAFGSSPLPAVLFLVLKITLPPIPVKNPGLYIIFHAGATIAKAAVPPGPLILPEHRHINNSVNTEDQGAAKGEARYLK